MNYLKAKDLCIKVVIIVFFVCFISHIRPMEHRVSRILPKDLRLMILDCAFGGSSKTLNTLVRQWGITPEIADKMVRAFIAVTKQSSLALMLKYFKTSKATANLTTALSGALERFRAESALGLALSKGNFAGFKQRIADTMYVHSGYWQQLLGVAVEQPLTSAHIPYLLKLTYGQRVKLQDDVDKQISVLEHIVACLLSRTDACSHEHKLHCALISAAWLAGLFGVIIGCVIFGERIGSVSIALFIVSGIVSWVTGCCMHEPPGLVPGNPESYPALMDQVLEALNKLKRIRQVLSHSLSAP